MKRFQFYFVLTCVLGLGVYGLEVYPVPLQGGPELLRSLLLLAVFVWVLLGCGRALLGLFHLYTMSFLEEAVLSFGLGCLGFSLFTQLLGLFGLLTPLVAFLALGAMGFAFSAHLEHFVRLFSP